MMYQNGLDETCTMTPEQRAMRNLLLQMVHRITADGSLRDDLMQEALVHLWLTETRRPGQTRSWYLQSCRFHLQHYLASGRSIDSAKRREGRMVLAQDSEDGEGYPEQGDSGNSVVTSVSARELLALLNKHLQPHERAVLECLADGLGAREIGRELKISHTMVIRHRRKIACLLNRLEAIKAVQWKGVKPINGHTGNGHTGNGHTGNGHTGNGHGHLNGAKTNGHRHPRLNSKFKVPGSEIRSK
jgi:DNA-directed RNA polymerase specialized sigma24 family protein